ncbi:HSPBB protein, partial [Eudromia elegans]|nr:HSPBB protein [Eudromia elegans]
MLCRMHLLPFATRLGTVRTLWPSPESIFTDLRQEMERVREFMSGFESLLSSQSGFAGDRAQGSIAAAAPTSDEGFCVSQDVKDFAPEQLSVKVVGRKVMLVAQKETQNADDKGAFSYKYEVLKREWDVPEDVDAEALSCSL